jgi:hypothetical protein
MDADGCRQALRQRGRKGFYDVIAVGIVENEQRGKLNARFASRASVSSIARLESMPAAIRESSVQCAHSFA